MYFYNGLHGLYGFLVARGDDGRMQNNPNCGKTLPKLK